MWTPFTLLVPFLLLVLIYYMGVGIHDANRREQTVRSAILKCLPIVYLVGLVAWTNVGNDEDVLHLQKYITLGLIASMCGDWFLNWMNSMFLPGALCFIVAHAMFIAAFGISPFMWSAAFVFGCVTILMGVYIQAIVTRKEDAVAKYLLTIYFGVISLMAWRAYAYYASNPTGAGPFQAMVGAIIFMVSDFLIVATTWHFDTSLKDLYVMTTYYCAQLMISLSVVQHGL